MFSIIPPVTNESIARFDKDVVGFGASPVDTGKAFLARFLEGMDSDLVDSQSVLEQLADSLRAAGYTKYDAVDDLVKRIDPVGSMFEIDSLSLV